VDVWVLEGSDRACDVFVRAHAADKICHRPAWSEMLRRDLGYDAFYLVACEGGEIRGVLPLTHVKSWLFGNRIVSQAFGNYGGPLAASREAMDALVDLALCCGPEIMRKHWVISVLRLLPKPQVTFVLGVSDETMRRRRRRSGRPSRARFRCGW